ncbi:hypothetical protein IGI04_018696 [Brassica rapa subsp. trilocularis]|uniref:At2g35280-like TPR domain-containing protein n=1 Tax=Brassica rapa subsp. trilocularis TaxID=1813537 RepID=A0ABQ7ME52_BRACM|nr:hypothetical protein IGI04_018696 [Brassica rapa subsp. trilocularis]
MSHVAASSRYHPSHSVLRWPTTGGHYILGIEEYHMYKNINIGVHHIRTTATTSHDYATYLYGLLMLCTENFNEWSTYSDKLR